MITLAATGHRPEKLGGYSHDVRQRLRNLAREYLTHRRPDEAISGMAQGWDWGWAEAAIDLDIPLIAAIPFEGQERLWSADTQREYRRLVGLATRVVVVSQIACARSMHLRDRWMVDHSTDEIVALWDGTPTSGTANCVVYAERKKRRVENLWSVWTKGSSDERTEAAKTGRRRSPASRYARSL